jgi:predicted SAM-dependent methyltransferase
VRINFGCGSVQPEGWANVDRVDYGQEHVADLLAGLPFPDGSVEYVVANHSLSDLDHHELGKALPELRRILVPGGVLRILVPNLLAAVAAYHEDDAAWFPLGDDLPSVDERLCTFVGWFGTARSQWTYGYATALCLDAGFVVTADAEPHASVLCADSAIADLDDREVQALIVEARK